MEQINTYSKITNSIMIEVIPIFLDERSSKQNNLFSWAYNVRIENLSNVVIQLVNRHCKIINSSGLVQNTDGIQSTSEQVIIEPGRKLVYTNATHLNTPSGMGLGIYEMRDMNTGHLFTVDMPTFSLDSPYEEHMPA